LSIPKFKGKRNAQREPVEGIARADKEVKNLEKRYLVKHS
jgi:hypothetical protein